MIITDLTIQERNILLQQLELCIIAGYKTTLYLYNTNTLKPQLYSPKNVLYKSKNISYLFRLHRKLTQYDLHNYTDDLYKKMQELWQEHCKKHGIKDETI